MKMRSKFPLAMLCVLWFGTADPAPAAAFDAGPAAPGGKFSPVIRLSQSETWVQFFQQNRRRDGQNQRRRRRNNDFIPLRTDPGEPRLRMRELGPQERRRNRNQRREQDAAREAVRRGDILPLGGIIQSAQNHCPGKFLGAKLQRGGGGFSYRVRILRPSGRRVGLVVDAKTGDVVGGRCR